MMISFNLKEHFTPILRIALPVSFSQAGQVMVGIADSLMVGQLGKEPLAAAALSNSIFTLPLLLGIGVSYGTTPLVASYDGQKDFTMIGQLLKHGLIINMVTALLLYALFYNFSVLISWMDQPKDVVILTIPFFKIILLSILPVMVFQSFKQFAEGLSMTKQAMLISIGGNIINIILNYILIYGKLGFAAYGLNGAAIATLISRVLMALSMGMFIFYSAKIKPYIQNSQFKMFNKTIARQLLAIGIPSAFQFMFEVSAFTFAAIMMGWVGTKELAAHQIALSIAALTYMFATGFSAGAVVRVGNFFGTKDKVNLRESGYSSFILAGGFMMMCATVFIIFNRIFPTLYIDDEQVISIASKLIIVAALFQVSDGLQVVGLGVLRGMKDVKIPTLITFVSYWLIGLPAGYVLGIILHMRATGIWIGLLLGLTTSAVLLLLRFNFKSKNLTF